MKKQVKPIFKNKTEIQNSAKMWYEIFEENKKENEQHITAILSGKKRFKNHIIWKETDMKIVSFCNTGCFR